MYRRKLKIVGFIAVALTCLLSTKAATQYRADFNYSYKGFEPNNLPGWTTRTGDGNVIFRQKYEEGCAVLNVDARRDERNIWYAFMHQNIASSINLEKLKLPEYELRMEARVKPSHVPRRVNMYLSTLDEGGYLREFDLDKANEWHTISMVTNGFEFDPDKPLMTQVSMMDWGINDIFELHVDYIQVDLVKVTDDQVQHGLPLEYHPALRDASAYKEEVVANSNILDKSFPDEVLKPWVTDDGEKSSTILQVDQSKMILLSWELEKFKERKVAGSGQLELSTHSLFHRKDNTKDFGMIRFCEIMHTGHPLKNGSLTYNTFTGPHQLQDLVVSQCIIDSEVDPEREGKTIVTISQPVLQRLLEGRTKGIAILPLGLISAVFYDESNGEMAPVIRFNLDE